MAQTFIRCPSVAAQVRNFRVRLLRSMFSFQRAISTLPCGLSTCLLAIAPTAFNYISIGLRSQSSIFDNFLSSSTISVNHRPTRVHCDQADYQYTTSIRINQL